MRSIIQYIFEGRKKQSTNDENKKEGLSILDRNDTVTINQLKNIMKINGPVIYAFITDKIDNAVKIGYTDQHPEKRINQWKKKYGKKEGEVKCIGYWSAEEINEAGNKVFFWDHAVHKKVEKRGFPNITKAEFKSFLSELGRKQDAIQEIYFSKEFFRKYRDIIKDDSTPAEREELSATLIEDILNGMKESIRNNTMDFDTFNYENKKRSDDIWKAPATYSNTSLQKEAIRNGIEAIKAKKKNLLMAAVMRFGKTHAAYEIIKGANLKNVVVVSAKADVREAWRNDINHIDFYKDFVFIEVLSEYMWDITAYDETSNILITKHLNVDKESSKELLKMYSDNGKTLIYFFTLHDLAGSLTKIKNKHRDIFDKQFDMMVIDETHYGSHANSFGRVTGLNTAIDEDDVQDYEEEKKLAEESKQQIMTLNIKYDTMLQVSGTPYYILASNEMLEDDAEIISKVSYTDMIEARDNWNEEHMDEDPTTSPYYGIPTLHKIGLNLTKECRKIVAESGNTDSLSTLFKVSGGKFKYESAIDKLMKSIFGDGSDDSLALLKNKIVEGNKVCHHTIIVLPKIDACVAMKDLLSKFIDTSEREIINIVGPKADISDIKSLNNKLEELDNKNKKSIILTVYKFLTGVSIPLVDSMIYLKNAHSPQEYDQNIFRLCTRNVKKVEGKNGPKAVNMKDNVYLIDFNISNMFNMMANSARMKANADKEGEEGKAKRIAKYLKQDLKTIPLYCEYSNSNEILGKMKQMEYKDLMKVYAGYNDEKSVADITTSEMDMFKGLFMDKGFQNIISKINSEADNSKITINGVNNPGEDEIEITPVDSKNKTEKHISDMAKSVTDKEKNEAIKITRAKFQQICKNLLYCNLVLDNPYTDIDSILKDNNPEFTKMLHDFEISKKDLEAIYYHMKPEYKECINNMLLKISLLVNDIEKKGIKQYQKAMEGLGKIKKNEVVTPEEIVNKMIGKLSKEDFEKAESILLVNEKQGEFLIGIYEKFGKKVASKCKIVPSSEMTIYLIRKTLKHLGLNNYIKDIIINIDDVNGDGKYDVNDFLSMSNEDILKENNGKKMDIILSNPPYDKKLHEQFLEKYIQIGKKIISIQPLTWLTNQKQNKKITQEINNLYCNLEQIDPNKYFDAYFAQDVAIHFIDINKNKQIIFNDIKYEKCEEITKHSNDKFLVEFNKIISNIINKSLDNQFKYVPDIPGHPKDKHTEYNPQKNWYIIKGAAIRGHVNTNDFFTLIPKPNTNEFKTFFIGTYDNLLNKEYRGRRNLSYYWAFNSEKEANNFVKYIQTDFCRTCLMLNKTTTNIIGGALKLIPWFDFSDEHFNKSPKEIDDWLFKKYNISNEIRKHIEEILPDYYGIR